MFLHAAGSLLDILSCEIKIFRSIGGEIPTFFKPLDYFLISFIKPNVRHAFHHLYSQHLTIRS